MVLRRFSLSLTLAIMTMAVVWFVRVRSGVLLLGVGRGRRLLWGLPLLLGRVLWLNLVDNRLLRLLSICGPPGTRLYRLRCLLLGSTENLE